MNRFLKLGYFSKNKVTTLRPFMSVASMNDQEVRRALAKLQVNRLDDVHNVDGMIASDEDVPFVSSSLYGNSQRYTSKWATSKANDDDSDDEAEGKEDNQYQLPEEYELYEDNDIFDNLDDLPPFADDECRELCNQIKLMEIKKLEASKQTKEHTERVSLMKDHLENVRQEIVHTNGLLAAKQNGLDTETHLIALADREKVAITTEIKAANASIHEGKDSIRVLQDQIHVANEGMETLKLSLNWNQEELEQWATAAAKKESDNQALEKYRRADEVKIKELTLKLENLTKISFAKRAEVDNEKTETQSKQLEVNRITNLFKQNHEERRQLIWQWQKTVEAMKDRDVEIDKVSMKYRDASEEVDTLTQHTSQQREDILYLKVRCATLLDPRFHDSGSLTICFYTSLLDSTRRLE